MQDALNEPPLEKPSTEVLPLVKLDENEDNDDLYWFVDTLENWSEAPLKRKPQDSSLLLNKTKCAHKGT